jgi:hypothetical protein
LMPQFAWNKGDASPAAVKQCRWAGTVANRRKHCLTNAAGECEVSRECGGCRRGEYHHTRTSDAN